MPGQKPGADYSEECHADLQRARVNSGRSTTELAKRLNLDVGFVEGVEAGTVKLNIGGIRRWFCACDAPYGRRKTTKAHL